MSNPLIRKLEASGELLGEDWPILARIADRPRQVEAYRDLAREGDRPEHLHLIMEGVACRYKLMPGGRRQILALFLPGDFCDLHVAILGEMDHSIATLTPCTVVDIPREIIRDLTANHPRINHALWWATLVDEGILREWLANIGQRPADKRLAHFFCELLIRLQTVGRADQTGYVMPLKQTELGDIMGLSSVHVNRSLRELRLAGLVLLKNGRLDIPDLERLNQFCGFNPNYLHLVPRIGL